MQRTIKIKLEKNEDLIETIKIFSQVLKEINKIAIENKTHNKVELHKLTYKYLRKKYVMLPSALLQTARDIVYETLKRTGIKKINFKEYSAIRLDKRNLRVNLKYGLISISSIKKRLKLIFKSNPQISKYEKWSPIAGTLTFKEGNMFLNLVIEAPDIKPQVADIKNEDFLGIDCGINNILVCSNNQFFNSRVLRTIKGKYQYLKQVLQSKGTRSAKRKLKQIAGKEKRFVSDMNHCLSKTIANSSFKVFVLEDLKDMKSKKNGRKFNKKLGGWSFGEFRRFLMYKSEGLGKIVIPINPKYTSQRCSNCEHTEKTNRNRARFKCKKCGFELHADLNASKNIVEFGKSEFNRLYVNQPNVAMNEVSAYMDISYKPTNSLVGN